MFACEECGDDATGYFDQGEDYAFWLGRRFLPVCDTCKVTLENREPSDPDGEAFRGGEAAAFQAAQLETARRLK